MADDDDEVKTSPLAWGVLALIVAGAALAGCCFFFFRTSDATVTGKVTLEGQPVTGALIVFIAENEKTETTLTAQTNDKGDYKLIGNTGGGVPVGAYRIAVSKLALPDGTIPATKEQLRQARSQELLGNILPKVYEDRATTPLQCDIRSGANTVPIELKKEP